MQTVVEKYYHLKIGVDNLEYVGSPEYLRWLAWKKLGTPAAPAGTDTTRDAA